MPVTITVDSDGVMKVLLDDSSNTVSLLCKTYVSVLDDPSTSVSLSAKSYQVSVDVEEDVTGDKLLLESGDRLLLESGDFLLLEA